MLRIFLSATFALCFSAALPIAFADEPRIEKRAFVEAAASAPSVYVGQEVRLTLRFGIDEAWFRDHAVPLFRRELDVPVDVSAPWLVELAGATAIPELGWPSPSRIEPSKSFAVNGGAGRAVSRPADRGGRSFTVFEISRRYLPTAPGVLSVAGPTLRFAYATLFETDLVGARVAIDRKDALVSSAAIDLRVLPLPEADQPPGFAGPVGHFRVSAKANRTTLSAGEVLSLTLTISGDASLDGVGTPRLDDLDGWHVLGTTTREHSGAPRVATYELAPTRSGTVEIPAIPFAYFDPTPPGAYRVAKTDPIAIRVEGAPGGAAPIPPAGTSSEDAGSSSGFLMAGLVVVLSLGILLLRRRRERGVRTTDPAGDRLRAVLDGEDLREPFAAFLATRLRCAPAAVESPDLAARLIATGVEPATATRAASLMERLIAAQYGGGDPVSAEEVREIADRIR